MLPPLGDGGIMLSGCLCILPRFSLAQYLKNMWLNVCRIYMDFSLYPTDELITFWNCFKFTARSKVKSWSKVTKIVFPCYWLPTACHSETVFGLLKWSALTDHCMSDLICTLELSAKKLVNNIGATRNLYSKTGKRLNIFPYLLLSIQGCCECNFISFGTPWLLVWFGFLR